MAYVFTGSYFTITDNNGTPVSGGTAEFYEAGTSNLRDIYSEETLTTTTDNPATADSNGRLGNIFLAVDKYKIVIKDASGATLYTLDDFEVTSTTTFTGGLESTATETRAARTVNLQTGTTYTVQDSDRAKLISHGNASSVAVTLPQANSSTFISGWFVMYQNTGAGTITITPTTSTIDGAASITLEQDRGVIICSDGTNYYTYRGGLPSDARGSQILLSTVTASSSSSADFSGNIDSTYKMYRLEGSNITVSVDTADIHFKASTDGLSSFVNFANHVQTLSSGSSSYSATNSASQNRIPVVSGAGTGTGENVSFNIFIDNPSNATLYKNCYGQSSQYSSVPVANGGAFIGATLTASAIDSFRVEPASGNISGTIKLYGIL